MVKSSRSPIWRVQVFLRWARRLLLQDLPSEEAREVRQSVEEDGRFTERYALLCGLSAGIATLGLLQSSAAVVIGAMLVSPLMGPIAALGFGFASFDGRRISTSARVIATGAAIGVLMGILLTWISPIKNATPEIVARTAPTLLDLAVALLSGLAGGYATVHRKGETAIGVAIATALMPPLATLGYSLAVMRIDYAFGAGLLFLTNLAAIAFSFALVARLRGVARPLVKRDIKPGHVALGLVAFLVLATPLAITLQRVTKEALVTNAVRREVSVLLNIEPSQIAQLTVSCPPLEPAKISVIAVTPEFRPQAEPLLLQRISQMLGRAPDVSFRQIVAADIRTQTQSMIDAALQQQAAQQHGPPIEKVRTATVFPVQAAWAEESSTTIFVAPAALDGPELADYRAEETRLNGLQLGWRVALAPPISQTLFVAADGDGLSARELDDAIWALKRWAVRQVTVTGFAGRNTARLKAAGDNAHRLADIASVAIAESNIASTIERASASIIEQRYRTAGEETMQGIEIKVIPLRVASPGGTEGSQTP